MGNKIVQRLPTINEHQTLSQIQNLIHLQDDELFHFLLSQLWNKLIVEQCDGVVNENDFSTNSPYWKAIGFQHASPQSDLRGGGLLALDYLVYFATTYTEEAIAMIEERDERNIEQYLPFAAAGINVCFMLCEKFNIHGQRYQSKKESFYSLARNDIEMKELFAFTFILLFNIYIDTNATYMEFGIVKNKTDAILTKILGLGPQNVSQLAELGNIQMKKPGRDSYFQPGRGSDTRRNSKRRGSKIQNPDKKRRREEVLMERDSEAFGSEQIEKGRAAFRQSIEDIFADWDWQASPTTLNRKSTVTRPNSFRNSLDLKLPSQVRGRRVSVVEMVTRIRRESMAGALDVVKEEPPTNPRPKINQGYNYTAHQYGTTPSQFQETQRKYSSILTNNQNQNNSDISNNFYASRARFSSKEEMKERRNENESNQNVKNVKYKSAVSNTFQSIRSRFEKRSQPQTTINKSTVEHNTKQKRDSVKIWHERIVTPKLKGLINRYLNNAK